MFLHGIWTPFDKVIEGIEEELPKPAVSSGNNNNVNNCMMVTFNIDKRGCCMDGWLSRSRFYKYIYIYGVRMACVCKICLLYNCICIYNDVSKISNIP